MRYIRFFIQLSHPVYIIEAGLLYALGVGVAKYLGATIDWGISFIGYVWITMIQLTAIYLIEYFGALDHVPDLNSSPFSRFSGAIGVDKLPVNVAFWAAITTLTIATSITVLILQGFGFHADILILMVFIFAGVMIFSIPPTSRYLSGYEELFTSMFIANLIPAFAFLLQANEYHRLLAMSTFPLTALQLAMMISTELPNYSTDLKYDRRTLLVRLGWQRGMAIHNLLIFINYCLLGIAIFYGMPLSIALPPLLLFPLGLFQILMINRIASGAKPNWKILSLTAALLIGLTAYLIAFSFWIR